MVFDMLGNGFNWLQDPRDKIKRKKALNFDGKISANTEKKIIEQHGSNVFVELLKTSKNNWTRIFCRVFSINF